MLQSGQHCLYPCKIAKDQTGCSRLFKIWTRIIHEAVSFIGSQCHHSAGLLGVPTPPPACSKESPPVSLWVGCSRPWPAWHQQTKPRTHPFPLENIESFPLYTVHWVCSLIKALLWLILKPTDPEMSTVYYLHALGAILQQVWLRAAKCCKNFLPN